MDLKTLTSAIMEIAEEKEISRERIIEVIEDALASAYKKEFGEKRQKYIAELNPKTGEAKFWQVRQGVTEDMLLSEEEAEQLKSMSPEEKEESEYKEKIKFNPERHIMLEDAKKEKKDIEPGEELKIPVEPKEGFGRIAAQTAKQVILQKIKEAEREAILKEFSEKEGEVISGIVQRVEPRAVFLDVGRTSGILPKNEQVPGEFYRAGQRLKVFVISVEQSPRGPVIQLSRSYPKLVSKLFELEVPEISSGQVEIKSIAREAGSRTKIAVYSEEEGIDPIGSLVGQRGTRILAVINELGGEKIDVVEWSEESEQYITNALSPAKILEVKIKPKNKAEALVPEDQLSLAIGKEGQNARLAAKLTGWKIDITAVDEDGKKMQSISSDEVENRNSAQEKDSFQFSEEKPEKKESPKKEE